jgi:hypothetical protein
MRFSKNIEQLIIYRKNSTIDEILKYIEQAMTVSKHFEMAEILQNIKNRWDSRKTLSN